MAAMNRLEVLALFCSRAEPRASTTRALSLSMRNRLASLMQRLRSEDGVSFTLVTLLTLPYIWLVWNHEFLPMQDLGGHIELSFLHDRLAARDPAYTPFYRVAPQPWPNSLSTLVLSVIGHIFGFEHGVKLLLCVYAVAWPLSLAWLAKLLGRSSAVALFAVPSILDFNWALGFFNYLLGKPLVIVCVCAAISFSRAPGALGGALLIASVWLAFLAHGLAYIICGIWAGLAVLCFSRGMFRLLNLWPLVLSLAFPARYLLEQRKVPVVPGEWVFGTWDGMLGAGLWNHLGQLNPSDGEELGYLIGIAAWFLTALLAARREPREAGGDTAVAVFIWSSAAVLFVAWGRGPIFMPNVDLVSPRLLVFVWGLLMILPRALPATFARHVITMMMVAAVFVHVYKTNEQYRQFNQVEMQGFSQLIGMIPPGKSVAVAHYRAASPFARENALWHWPKLYGVRKGKGGRNDDTFASRTTSYVNLTDAAIQSGTYSVPPMLDMTRVALFDYQLSVGTTKEVAAANLATVADYVASRAEWHLFRIRRPAQ